MGKVLGILTTVIGFIVAFFGLALYGIWAGAFVGCHLWEWFLVPLGIPAVTWIHLAGVGLLVKLYTYYIPTSQPKERETDWGNVGSAVLFPWITLFFGWVLHCWMT